MRNLNENLGKDEVREIVWKSEIGSNNEGGKNRYTTI